MEFSVIGTSTFTCGKVRYVTARYGGTDGQTDRQTDATYTQSVSVSLCVCV